MKYRKSKKFKVSGCLKESEIVRQGIYALRKLNFIAWRNNNIAVYDKKRSLQMGKNIYRKNPLMLNGVADIIAITPQRNKNDGLYTGTFYCEAKAEDGIQSEEQKWFQNCVEQGGEIYIIFRSIDDLFVQLKQKNILK